MNRTILVLTFIALLGCLYTGCSNQASVVETPLAPVHERLLIIGRAYIGHLQERGAPPKNEQQLRAMLSEEENIPELFLSPRDEKPFVICWNVDLNGPLPWAKSLPIIAYEQQGVDGSRYVLTTMRSVEPVSETDFRQASFPPGHQPEN